MIHRTQPRPTTTNSIGCHSTRDSSVPNAQIFRYVRKDLTHLPTTVNLLHCHQVLQTLSIAEIALLADQQSHRQTRGVRSQPNAFFDALTKQFFHHAIHIRSRILETWQQARKEDEERLGCGIESRTPDISTSLQDLSNPVQSGRELISPTILVEQA